MRKKNQVPARSGEKNVLGADSDIGRVRKRKINVGKDKSAVLRSANKNKSDSAVEDSSQDETNDYTDKNSQESKKDAENTQKGVIGNLKTEDDFSDDDIDELNEVVTSDSDSLDHEMENDIEKQRKHKRTKIFSKRGMREPTCNYCNSLFSSKAELKTHTLTEHKDRKMYKCLYCPKEYRGSCSRGKHIMTVHFKEYRFQCHVCGERFLNESRLKQHIYCYHTSVKDKKQFPCRICGKVFYSKAHNKMHEYLHVGEKKVPCTVEGCGKLFRTKNQLQKHLPVHSDVKPFICQDCGKAFRKKHGLHNHSLSHKGIKFQCLECQKVFSTKGNLRVHMKVHEGVQFTCEVCSKTFNFKSNYNFHMKQHFGKEEGTPDEKSGRKLEKKMKEAGTKRTKTKYTQFSSTSLEMESKMMCNESDTEIQNQNVGKITPPSDDVKEHTQEEAEDISASSTDVSTQVRNYNKGIIGRSTFAEVSGTKKYIVLNTNEMATRLICKMAHNDYESSNEKSPLQPSTQDDTANTCANDSKNAHEISPTSKGMDLETAAYNSELKDEPVEQEVEGVTIQPEEFLINCKRPVAVLEKANEALDKTNDLTEEDIEKIVYQAHK
ncbi:oocyte zinc finger protein XlCOF6-like [Dreissena polymorpha]|uniref:C2H2-type domain-containing protein n=1 Tax=Dreissena polymorpha TaxID=45954 RepID=A0A9D4GZU5_DREPO|nr:oocyte zinc finger protein XlCOF6-like [Dreissena polymorpha]KAH3825882.1 hypothetical protein DPMN_127766 [Dreissena polymorpha]